MPLLPYPGFDDHYWHQVNMMVKNSFIVNNHTSEIRRISFQGPCDSPNVEQKMNDNDTYKSTGNSTGRIEPLLVALGYLAVVAVLSWNVAGMYFDRDDFLWIGGTGNYGLVRWLQHFMLHRI